MHLVRPDHFQIGNENIHKQGKLLLNQSFYSKCVRKYERKVQLKQLKKEKKKLNQKQVDRRGLTPISVALLQFRLVGWRLLLLLRWILLGLNHARACNRLEQSKSQIQN